jgi:hypothetical protein
LVPAAISTARPGVPTVGFHRHLPDPRVGGAETHQGRLAGALRHRRRLGDPPAPVVDPVQAHGGEAADELEQPEHRHRVGQLEVRLERVDRPGGQLQPAGVGTAAADNIRAAEVGNGDVHRIAELGCRLPGPFGGQPRIRRVPQLLGGASGVVGGVDEPPQRPLPLVAARSARHGVQRPQQPGQHRAEPGVVGAGAQVVHQRGLPFQFRQRAGVRPWARPWARHPGRSPSAPSGSRRRAPERR